MGLYNANYDAGVVARWVLALGLAFGVQLSVDTVNAQSYPIHAQNVGGSDWSFFGEVAIVDGYKWKLGNGIPQSSDWHVNLNQMHKATLFQHTPVSGQCYRVVIDPFDFAPDNPNALNIAWRVTLAWDDDDEETVIAEKAAGDGNDNLYIEYTVSEPYIDPQDVTIEVWMQGKNELATVGIASFDVTTCGGGVDPDPDPDPTDESDWPDGARIIRAETECGVWYMDWATYKDRDGETWEKIHSCAIGHGDTATFSTVGESPFDPLHVTVLDEATVDGEPFVLEWEPGVESPAAQELLNRIVALYPEPPGSHQPGQAPDQAATAALVADVPACDGDCNNEDQTCCYSVADADKDGTPDALDETPFGGEHATFIPVSNRSGEIGVGAYSSIPIGTAGGIGDTEFAMVLPIQIPGMDGQSEGVRVSTYVDNTTQFGAALDALRLLCRAFALMCFSTTAAASVVTTFRQW